MRMFVTYFNHWIFHEISFTVKISEIPEFGIMGTYRFEFVGSFVVRSFRTTLNIVTANVCRQIWVIMV